MAATSGSSQQVLPANDTRDSPIAKPSSTGSLKAEDLSDDHGRDEEPLSVSRGLMSWKGKTEKAPIGAKWRSSSWYITLVVALGVATDALAYQIVVPVLPYHLQELGYDNISALTSWLLFAYSAGIFVSILPVAYYFNKYPYRRGPLVVAVIALEGGLILFMLVQPYPVMVISRFIQGAASAVVWSVGFALICENCDEQNIGRQIGFATSGVSVGTTAAPPIGGFLYFRFGWYAPFIFTTILCAIDTVMRMFVIEQKELKRWFPVQAASKNGASSPTEADESESTTPRASRQASVEAIATYIQDPESPSVDKHGQATGDEAPAEIRFRQTAGSSEASRPSPPSRSLSETAKAKQDLPPWLVFVSLCKSKRGMTGFFVTFVYGMFIGTLDPTLTLHIEQTWHKESDFVGLVYLAASAPTFLTGPIVGALADKWGSEYLIAPSLLLTLPWLPLMIMDTSLPAFVVYFAMSQLFISCAMAPVGLEITMAARESEGMSEIHQFASMNISFALSTSVGAIAGGQMYDHLQNGWTAVLWFCFAIVASGIPLGLTWAGKQPLWRIALGKRKRFEDGDAQVEGSISPSREQ